ncbi:MULTISPECIES: cytochrome b/b6 domain-containing protein [Frankia]|uniref:Formate dehydrogenase n=1 Tax=Frankia alni (strain DSM 45986 / CECT 9034 / ACN14a) TaxID=326424 RepID=Q0RSX0_FRAAA|nr:MULTISPECIES: cytochrome b/b6 domain-containing protein [Frankia]CAJ59334.1 putative Formate dehydrogenase [Frankia alni ACN14a]
MKPSDPPPSPADLPAPGSGRIATPSGLVRRFGRVPRWVHWLTAALMGCCLLTGATLYLPPLARLVGRRQLVETVHLYAGLALPVPMLVAAVSAGYRRDLRALNRFTAADRAWLRASLRFGSWRRAAARARIVAGVGKFNAGQKLFAAFVAGGALVMLGTGMIMQWGAGPLGPIPIGYRTGATFVHDLLAYGLFFGVVGHLWMAAHDPVARVGIRTGTVPVWWAAREHPAWAPAPAVPSRPAPGETVGRDGDSGGISRCATRSPQ